MNFYHVQTVGITAGTFINVSVRHPFPAAPLLHRLPDADHVTPLSPSQAKKKAIAAKAREQAKADADASVNRGEEKKEQ